MASVHNLPDSAYAVAATRFPSPRARSKMGLNVPFFFFFARSRRGLDVPAKAAAAQAHSTQSRYATLEKRSRRQVLLLRLLLLTSLLAPTAHRLAAAEQGQLDGSPTLFSVLAAINAAGYDADLDSPANHPLRAAVRKAIGQKNPAVLAELKRFFSSHRQKDWGAELSQYVSFALSTDGPPAFKYRFQEYLLPPDVQPLRGFEKLMQRFRNEAGIDQLWSQAQPAYEQAIGRYTAPVSRAVLDVNAYLRNPTSGFLGRRFQIYIDLLGAPNQIHTRSYADDYFVVVTPSPEPQTEDVRHAYLHYLLDPLAMKFSEDVNKKKGLGDFAQAAPVLEEYYKEDFLLLLTESLIKAVEARLATANRQAMVQQALREGFILAPFFAEHLPVYEKQDRQMRLYFPDMIKAIDLKAEDKRLEGVQFTSERPVRKAKTALAERKLEPTPVQKTLEAADQAWSNRDLEKARKAYLDLLQQTDEKPLHAKSYYGLARIAALQKDPELAQKLFQRVLELEPDPRTKSWSLIYLGRLADAQGERDQAMRHFQDALACEGAPEDAVAAARKGLQEPLKK